MFKNSVFLDGFGNQPNNMLVEQIGVRIDIWNSKLDGNTS